MADVKIKAMDNGPLLVEGDVDILDGTGNELDNKQKCFLCRCGLSTNTPYCSGAHKGKFEDEVRAE